MRISAAQFGPTGHAEHNLEVITRLVAEAAQHNAELVVLPEEAMLAVRFLDTQNQHTVAEAVAQAWPRFTEQLSRLAAEYQIAIVAGAYEPSDTDKPFNTVVAVGADGAQLAQYRKLHLYDAFQNLESDRITAGDRGVTVFEYRGITFGVLTCYDVRFPEVARALTLRGAQAILIPAAWYAGENKIDHWRTFVTARALENTVWVVAANTIGEDTIGHSMIVDPLSVVTETAGSVRAGVVTHEIDLDRVDEVRQIVPVLANRRTDVEDLRN